MNVLAKQDTDVQRDQGMIATNDSTVNELEMWFAELHAAYQAEPAASYAVRKHRLLALKKQLSRYQDVLAQAMSQDFGGRCHTESVMADILAPILDINHVVRHLKSWMKPSRRPTEWLFKGNKLEVRYQPKGVVGIICPWNFPLYLSLRSCQGVRRQELHQVLHLHLPVAVEIGGGQGVRTSQPRARGELTRTVVASCGWVVVASSSIGTTVGQVTRTVIDGSGSVVVTCGSVGTTSARIELTRTIVARSGSVVVASACIGTTVGQIT